MAKGTDINRTCAIVATLIAALACMLALSLAGAPTASAQLPAICEEYPNDPSCELPNEPPENPSPNGDEDPTGNQGGTGDTDGNGDLPFTGYPLTGLILLLVVLIAAGLAVRGYMAARERVAARSRA